MKPPFSYHGGKGRQAAWLLSLLPEHHRYVEPFAGSAAVFFAKDASRVEILNDRDNAIWAFLTSLRDHPTELERACRLTPYSRTEFHASRLALDGSSPSTVIETARNFYTVISQGFASVPATKGFSVPSERSSEAHKVQGHIDRFEQCAARLRDAHIENLDASEILRRYDSPRTVFLVDPPYLWSTRSWAPQQRTKQDYRVEMQTDSEHEALLQQLTGLQAAVVLCGRSNDLYDQTLADWTRHDGPNNEVAWVNR